MKWFNKKKADGTLEDGVKHDEAKMIDVNFYTNFVEGKDMEKVNNLLMHIKFLKALGTNKAMAMSKDKMNELMTMEPEKEKTKKGK